MTAIIDSGFLYATFDKSDKNHSSCVEALTALSQHQEILLLPNVVLVEVSYLLQARLGHKPMRRFFIQLTQGALPLVHLTNDDLTRVEELLEQYAEMRLDFVDAAIVTLAERLNVKKILTVDRRDFRVIRPNHCDYFELVPEPL